MKGKKLTVKDLEEMKLTVREWEGFKKPFSKSDLKTGMWVECKDGWKALVLRDTPKGELLITQSEFMNLDEIKEDLSHIDGGDLNIVKVFEPLEKQDVATGGILNLIWERKEQINKVEHKITRSITYKDEQIKVIYARNKTEVILNDNTKGTCSCHPEDNFDKNKGLGLAYYRAKEKQIKNKINKLLK